MKYKQGDIVLVKVIFSEGSGVNRLSENEKNIIFEAIIYHNDQSIEKFYNDIISMSRVYLQSI